MNTSFYEEIAKKGLAGEMISRETAKAILVSEKIELLPLINAAFQVRKKHAGLEVTVHIINNGQNGLCPEDCHYCAQAKTSKADIEAYPIKSDEEILAEAKTAHEKGAFRYCMVFAGRGPSRSRVEHLARLIQEIKARYPLQVCVSAGLMDEDKARVLKEAGLDRLNHNLNTSRRHYPEICSTHTYADRINTLKAARNAGLQLCSGVIVGMKETVDDILDTAYELRKMEVESIPVNFLIPIPGNKLDRDPRLNPQLCLRILCLFRFLNPKAEIRIAAGREMHLRDLEVMALYPANSLFLDGYLNAKGEERKRTFQMIRDAGFIIKSEYKLDELIQNEDRTHQPSSRNSSAELMMKGLNDLRPKM